MNLILKVLKLTIIIHFIKILIHLLISFFRCSKYYFTQICSGYLALIYVIPLIIVHSITLLI